MCNFSVLMSKFHDLKTLIYKYFSLNPATSNFTFCDRFIFFCLPSLSPISWFFTLSIFHLSLSALIILLPSRFLFSPRVAAVTRATTKISAAPSVQRTNTCWSVAIRPNSKPWPGLTHRPIGPTLGRGWTKPGAEMASLGDRVRDTKLTLYIVIFVSCFSHYLADGIQRRKRQGKEMEKHKSISQSLFFEHI